MKRLVAMIAIFTLASLAAAYVALAPLSSPTSGGLIDGVFQGLDSAAARLSAPLGRANAVTWLIGLGVALAVLAGYFMDRGLPPIRGHRTPARPAKSDPPPGTERSVQPREPSERIADLRRRAEALVEEESVTSTGETPADGQPAPVVLIRRARERDRDWFADTSWFGGLPRLGSAHWPRDRAGQPLPFAAQIDLSAVAAAFPGSPLTAAGSLAFFLGSGAVVNVPADQAHEFTAPPEDLPPAFEEGGGPFPPHPSRLARHFFPYWPVSPLPLAVPRDLAQRAGPDREAAILRALGARMPALVASRPRAFRSTDWPESPGLWWHSVQFLADWLHAALEEAQTPLAQSRARIEFQRELAHDEAAAVTPEHRQAAREELARLETELARSEERLAALPAMVDALEQFTANRAPWQRLTSDEQRLVEEILTEVNAHYLEFVRGHLPATPDDLATVTLRAMVSGPAEALEAVPDDVLDRINRDHRLADRAQHRLFGPALPAQAHGDARPGASTQEPPLLLLQLGADDLIDWRWTEGKVFRFRIARAEANAGNWAAASLHYEDV